MATNSPTKATSTSVPDWNAAPHSSKGFIAIHRHPLLSWSDENASHFKDAHVFIHVNNVICHSPLDDFGKPCADQGRWQAVIATVGLTPQARRSLTCKQSPPRHGNFSPPT